MSRMVEIRTFSTITEAELAKSILAANGIEAMMSADDVGGLMGDTALNAGVRLMVLEENAKHAAEVLTNQGGG